MTKAKSPSADQKVAPNDPAILVTGPHSAVMAKHLLRVAGRHPMMVGGAGKPGRIVRPTVWQAGSRTDDPAYVGRVVPHPLRTCADVAEETAATLPVGTVVTLKSGGQHMTVSGHDVRHVDVLWFSPNGELHGDTFPAECLAHVLGDDAIPF